MDLAMLNERKDLLYDNFKRYFPVVANGMRDFYLDGMGCLVVHLDDGSAILYDDMEKTIRPLPRDVDHMTEDECRREFGKRLYKIMFLKGITQEDLAALTGIHRTMISQYITGKHTPSFYAVDKIAKAIGCSIDELRYR